jgi:hypothetical protein
VIDDEASELVVVIDMKGDACRQRPVFTCRKAGKLNAGFAAPTLSQTADLQSHATDLDRHEE